MPDFLEDLKRTLGRQQADIFQQHRQGIAGLEEVRALTNIIDQLLERIHAHYTTDVDGLPLYCLVGLGGYGRKEMCPASDIDLMFLYDRDVPSVQKLFTSILRVLWDLGFDVGHSYRSISECLKLVNEDIVTATAIMESRLILGNASFYETYDHKVRGRFLKNRGRFFLDSKVKEAAGRHAEYQHSCFLREPDIKNGVGGLRDIQAALCIHSASPRHIGRWDVGFLPDLDILKDEQDFLLRVRCELHYLTKRKTNKLDFDLQPAVAANLTGEAADKRSVETFMQRYYTVARNVNRCLRLEFARFQWYSRWRKVRRHLLGNGLVSISGKLYFAKKPGPETGYFPSGDDLARIFRQARKWRLPLSEQLIANIWSYLLECKEDIVFTQNAYQDFLDMIREPGIYHLLLQMHETGLMMAMLPEITAITCYSEHDSYHAYTIDQHTLLAIKEIEDLEKQPEKARPNLIRILKRGAPRHLLVLALLFHDAGKPHGHPHSLIGSRIAERVLKRFPLKEEEVETVVFLVLEHLKMAQFAQRRDFNELLPLKDFTREINSLERLELLYLLTFADIRAVSPHLWTEWQGALLAELFQKASILMTQSEVEGPTTQEQKDIAEISFRAAGLDPALANAFLESLPNSYRERQDLRKLGEHYRLFEQADLEPVAVRILPGRTTTEVTIAAKDRAGLLAVLAAAFSGSSLRILGLEAHSFDNGKILDIFQIADFQGGAVTNMDIITRITKILTRLVTGQMTPEALLKDITRSRYDSKSVRPVFPPPTRVNIDNETSPRYTILEIFSAPVPGSTYRNCKVVSEAALNIYSAMLSWEVDQELTVLYLTDREGRKVEDPNRLDALKSCILKDPSGNP